MPVEGRGPELGAVRKGGRDMTTGASLTGSASVRKLQTVLHAKAKEEPWTGAFTPSSTRYGGRTSCWRRGGWSGTTVGRLEWTV